MWNDIETTEDLLNFQVIADATAQLIKESNSQPISIGISGSWGVGKTSLSKMITKTLYEDPNEQNYIFIDFDAWLYQGYDDAKLALLQIVSDRLMLEAEENESILDKAKEFAKRINWLRVGKILAPVIGGAVTGGVVGGPVGLVIGAVGGILKSGETPSPEQLESLKDAYSNLGPALPGLLKEHAGISMPKEISELRRVFSEILTELDTKLVITVDDLDRCLPSTAISTLEAIRLLLFMPNTAFIIAADEQMIRNAVKVHFGDDDMSSQFVTSYFDKLIQVPIYVPRLGNTEIKAYLVMLLAEERLRKGDITDSVYSSAKKSILQAVKQSWKKELTITKIEDAFGDAAAILRIEIEMADQLAGLLVNSDRIMGNPRLIKRFLNDLLIRRKIADAQGLSIAFDEQVKIQLFERCASSRAFEVLLQKVSDVDGKVAFLQELEESIEDGKDNLEFPDKSWEEDKFVRGWLELKPRLGTTDLRPLLYLSRDRSISMHNAYELSPEGQRILAILSVSSRFASSMIDQIKSVGEAEAKRLFVRIKKSVRSQQWELRYVTQCLYFPQAFPSLKDTVISFLNEMPADKRIPAIVPLLKRFEWGISLLQEWNEKEDTSKQTKIAIKSIGGI